MKPIHFWIFWTLLVTGTIAFAQSLEEQFQAADAELNRVYKELRSKLNEQQKAELKDVQKTWLKDVYKIADQARPPQEYLTPEEQRQQFLVEATLKRTFFLKNIFQKITGISFLKHEFQKADQELNSAYQQLRSQLGKEESEELKSEQMKWLKSFAKVGEDLVPSLVDVARTDLTKLRAMELKNRVGKSSFDTDAAREKARVSEETNYATNFGLRPVYQSCDYNAQDIVAESDNGKYRAISLPYSNRIYVFDNISKLLIGDFEVWGGIMEGVGEKILFSSCGRYIYTEKSGYQGGDHSFHHIPSLLPVLAETSRKQTARAPLFAKGGYVGLAMSSRDQEERLENAEDYLFVDTLSMSKGIDVNSIYGRSFLEKFPASASRIGVFYLLEDFSGHKFEPKFLTNVKKSSQGKSHVSKLDFQKSLNFFERPTRQIEEVSLAGDNFLLLERQGAYYRNLELNLPHLKLSSTGESSSKMLENPTTFAKDLRLYGEKLEAKRIVKKLGSLICEIEQKEDSALAKLSIGNPEQKIMVPWHGQQEMMFEFFQMARYHDGPKPLLSAYWMRQDKAWNDYTFGLYNPETRKWIYEGSNSRPGRYFSEIRRYWYDSSSGGLWLSEPSGSTIINDKYVFEAGSLKLIDIATGNLKEKLPCEQLFEVFAVGKNHLVGLPRMDEQRFEVWQMEPFSKLFDVIWDDDLSLSFFCTDGFYSTGSKSIKKMAVRSYEHAYPFEQFDLRLNRPDIVLERLGAPDEAIAIAKQLREKRLKRMGVTEDMLQPDFHLPEIEIVADLPSSTEESDLALKIKASDSKYPLDRLRLYVNNVPVNGKEGELLRDSKSQSLERTIPIKLAAGRNKIQISVLNSAGAESLYANAEVTCTAQRPKPTLYAVAMGVSEYANPEWNLKYAAKDARDILERVKARSGSSYGEIKELLITDREATKESLGKIREFLSKATVDDTVLLFVAGHGLLDSKYDYYFGTSDIDFDNPSGNGIAFEEFDDLLAELPCLRKSLLIDTCHAGELDEDEKKMLASAQANPSQVVAMLPTGARGMIIKPIEGARGKSEWYDRLQGLFVDLRRGSGSTILSSSAGAEYALESSEQKNGLFTYAVLEALDGKEGSDANKDGSVTMSELADYVKTRVAALTNNKQSPNVRRVNLEADFALSKK